MRSRLNGRDLSPVQNKLISAAWFAPIVRVGSTGLEEHLPTFNPDPASADEVVAK
jgi:hypothetical protein